MRLGRGLHVASLFLAALLVAALAGAVPLGSARAYASASGDFLRLLNGARASAGLHSLSVSGDLAAAANAQAARMARSHVLAHTPDLTGVICCWSSIGENVGEGPSVTSVHKAFMASAPHRANILGTAYTQVGIGTAVDSSGMLWVSEIFRRPSGSAPAPKPATTPKPAPTQRATTHAAPAPNTAAARTASHAASRGEAARPPLDPSVRFAAQLAGSTNLINAPDPVSRVLDFVAVTSDLSG